MTQIMSQPLVHRPCRPATEHWDISNVPMNTQGEVEAVICKRYQSLSTGIYGPWSQRHPRHLIADLLVVRLQGVLTVPEQRMVKLLPAEKGRDLLKLVRTHLIERRGRLWNQ